VALELVEQFWTQRISICTAENNTAGKMEPECGWRLVENWGIGWFFS
jgi:hypothetical protein